MPWCARRARSSLVAHSMYNMTSLKCPPSTHAAGPSFVPLPVFAHHRKSAIDRRFINLPYGHDGLGESGSLALQKPPHEIHWILPTTFIEFCLHIISQLNQEFQWGKLSNVEEAKIHLLHRIFGDLWHLRKRKCVMNIKFRIYPFYVVHNIFTIKNRYLRVIEDDVKPVHKATKVYMITTKKTGLCKSKRIMQNLMKGCQLSVKVYAHIHKPRRIFLQLSHDLFSHSPIGGVHSGHAQSVGRLRA